MAEHEVSHFLPRRDILHPLDDEDWEIVAQGALLRVKRTIFDKRKYRPAIRGECQGFSRQSRFRMLQTIARIDWLKAGSVKLITLTYPDVCRERCYVDRSRDRYRFHRLLERALQCHVPILWRCEWKIRRSGQCSGELAPHFHFVVFTRAFVAHQIVRQLWRAVLRVDGPLATDVRRREGPSAAMYVAKYAAKLDGVPSLDIGTYHNTIKGRAWGLLRAGSIPWAPVRSLRHVSPAVVAKAHELAHRLWHGHDRLWPGSFCVLNDRVPELFEALRLIGVDSMPGPRVHWRDQEGECAGTGSDHFA